MLALLATLEHKPQTQQIFLSSYNLSPGEDTPHHSWGSPSVRIGRQSTVGWES